MVLAFPPGKVLLQDALNSTDVFGLNRCKYCDGWDEPREREGKPKAESRKVTIGRANWCKASWGVSQVARSLFCFLGFRQLRNVSIYTFLSCIQVIILEQLHTLFPLLFSLALLIMLRLRFSCWLLLPIFDMHSNREETRQNVRCIYAIVCGKPLSPSNDSLSRLGCSTLPL